MNAYDALLALPPKVRKKASAHMMYHDRQAKPSCRWCKPTLAARKEAGQMAALSAAAIKPPPWSPQSRSLMVMDTWRDEREANK